MVWQIHPAKPGDREDAADKLAAVIWEIRRRLSTTPQLFVVDEVCTELGVGIKGAA